MRDDPQEALLRGVLRQRALPEHAQGEVVERPLHGRDELFDRGAVARTGALDGVRRELVEEGSEAHGGLD